MDVKNVEKDIMKQEAEQKHKVVTPIKKLFKLNRDKLTESVLKHAKKERIEIEEYDIENIVEEFWYLLSDEIEYVPGYIDEYVEAIEEKFYANGKVSLSKVAKYIIDKHIG